MSNERVIERLRRLIRLGESPDEAEAQNALEHATRIATKYHIDLASLDVNVDEGRQLGTRSSDVVLWGNRKKLYRWELAHVVARSWGCAPWTANRLRISMRHRPDDVLVERIFAEYMTHHSEKKIVPTIAINALDNAFEVVVTNPFGGAPGPWHARDFESCGLIERESDTVLVMFGRKDAAEAAIYTYHVLLDAVDSIAARVASGRAGRNSARLGLVFGLRNRLYKMMNVESNPDEDSEPTFDDEQLSKETALVLTEAREESVRYLEDCFGRKPYGGQPRHSIRDRASFRAGYNAADEIEIPDPNSGRANKLGGSRALPVGRDRQLGE